MVRPGFQPYRNYMKSLWSIEFDLQTHILKVNLDNENTMCCIKGLILIDAPEEMSSNP